MKGALPAVTALLFAVTAQADVIIRYKTTDLSHPQNASAGVLVFGPDRLATRSSSDPERTIYRGDKQLLWSVNDAARTYTELDKKEAERVAGLVNAKLASLEAKLLEEDLDDVERVETKGLIQRNTPPAVSPPPRAEVVKRTNDLKTINGFACTRYDVIVDGVKQSEIYAAPWGAGGLMKSDLRVFAQAEGFVTDVLNTMLRVSSPHSELLISRLWKVNGVPILIRDFREDRAVLETQIDSITRMDAAASTYTLPLGYTRKDPTRDLEDALRAEE